MTTKMTARELREVLYHVDRQDMTIRELREILFHVTNQDELLKDTEIQRMTWDASRQAVAAY